MKSYSLDELSQEVTRELEKRNLLGAAADHRVSAAPDARTIRYYTTLGLLERPLVQGRQARYGTHHLLQLLAVKALQSQGLALGDIQARLYGRDDTELQEVLESVSPPSRAAPAQARAGEGSLSPSARHWREVTIEPGLKLMVEDTWAPTLAPSARTDHIRAVLAALEPKNRDGGRP